MIKLETQIRDLKAEILMLEQQAKADKSYADKSSMLVKILKNKLDYKKSLLEQTKYKQKQCDDYNQQINLKQDNLERLTEQVQRVSQGNIQVATQKNPKFRLNEN